LNESINELSHLDESMNRKLDNKKKKGIIASRKSMNVILENSREEDELKKENK